jgi:hypothetical protein
MAVMAHSYGMLWPLRTWKKNDKNIWESEQDVGKAMFQTQRLRGWQAIPCWLRLEHNQASWSRLIWQVWSLRCCIQMYLNVSKCI